MEFDLLVLGFSEDELAQLLDPGVKEGLTDPDEIPEPPDEAITQPGDLWILGDHRLLCGDSGNPAQVDRLLAGAPIHLVNSDPPNNVPDLWHVKKINPTKMVHLTEKPVELAVRAMQYSLRAGENVLDLFGGSGSTLSAAISCRASDLATRMCRKLL